MDFLQLPVFCQCPAFLPSTLGWRAEGSAWQQQREKHRERQPLWHILPPCFPLLYHHKQQLPLQTEGKTKFLTKMSTQGAVGLEFYPMSCRNNLTSIKITQTTLARGEHCICQALQNVLFIRQDVSVSSSLHRKEALEGLFSHHTLQFPFPCTEVEGVLSAG